MEFEKQFRKQLLISTENFELNLKLMFLHSFLPFLFYFFALFIFLSFSRFPMFVVTLCFSRCLLWGDGGWERGSLCLSFSLLASTSTSTLSEVEFEIEVQVDIENGRRAVNVLKFSKVSSL